MLKRKCRDKKFEKYIDIETPKWEAKRKDEQWNPNPWEIVVMLILIFLGLYFLMDSFLNGIPNFLDSMILKKDQ